MDTEIIEKLRSGISLSDLNTYLNIADKDLLDKIRMNLIGNLRQQGYIIPKTRGFYQITGFEKKQSYLPASEWDDNRKKLLKMYETMYSVVSVNQVKRHIGQFYSNLHEYCPLYCLSYEQTDDTEIRIDSSGTFIVKKYKEQPRFYLLYPQKIDKYLVAILSQISRKPIKLVAYPDQNNKIEGYKRQLSNTQAIYDLNYLANSYYKDLSHGTQNQVKRNMAALRCEPLTSQNSGDAKRVVTLWKEGPAGQKQRQLAISRDYRAIDIVAEGHQGMYGYIFYRDNLPVSLEIFDTCTDNLTTAHIVSKALNYTQQPGGFGSTSTASLIFVAKDLLNRGLQYINGGAIEGGDTRFKEQKITLNKRF